MKLKKSFKGENSREITTVPKDAWNYEKDKVKMMKK